MFSFNEIISTNQKFHVMYQQEFIISNGETAIIFDSLKRRSTTLQALYSIEQIRILQEMRWKFLVTRAWILGVLTPRDSTIAWLLNTLQNVESI